MCRAHPLSISFFCCSYLQKIHEVHFTSSVISCPICFPCVQGPEQVHHFEEEMFGHGGEETPPHVKCALSIGLMHLSTSSQSAGNFFVSRKTISARQPSKHTSANFNPSQSPANRKGSMSSIGFDLLDRSHFLCMIPQHFSKLILYDFLVRVVLLC